MGIKDELDFFRVDIDASADDQVATPVADEKITALVDMADISIGGIALTTHARAIIVQIGEGYAASELDQADFASRQLPLAAVLCKDVDVAPDRASNGTGPGQPFVPADEGNASTTSPDTILMHTRPTPHKHPP